jgi:hypothetical protein
MVITEGKGISRWSGAVMTEERGITAKRKGTSGRNGGTRRKSIWSRQKGQGLVTAEGNKVVEGDLWAEVEKGRKGTSRQEGRKQKGCHGGREKER